MTPSRVLCGEASPEWMNDEAGRSPTPCRHAIVDGQEHVVPPKILGPVLADFFPERSP
jgi:hypothetical protein